MRGESTLSEKKILKGREIEEIIILTISLNVSRSTSDIFLFTEFHFLYSTSMNAFILFYDKSFSLIIS